MNSTEDGNGRTGRRLVFDTATNRIGEVMAQTRARADGPVISYWLRPVGGGIEWQTRPDAVQPVADAVAGVHP